jgi:tetratricopeptide (TPR) repeat protein
VIFEWYRGSDVTGEIPKRYTFLQRGPGKLFTPEQRVKAFDELVRQERDPNYKALFLYELAIALEEAEREEEVSEKLWQAFRTFDLIGASFPHVADNYAQVSWLLAEEWVKKGEPTEELERYAPAMLGALVWWDRSYLAAWDLASCWYGLGRFFLLYAERYEDRTFAEFALLCGLRLHREFTEHPKWLFFLSECYSYLGDRDRCEKVLAMLRETDWEGEYLPRAERLGLPG